MKEHLRTIRRARTTIGASRFLARAADAASVALALALVLTAIDATSPLSPAARLALGIASLLAVTALLGRAASAYRCTLDAAAARLESALGLTRNTLLNALQLARAETTSPVGDERIRFASRHADELVKRAPKASVVDRRALGRPLARFAIVAASFALFLMITPRVAESAWLRFTQPFAGHPPYSRTEFEIAVTPVPLLMTMDARITVRTSLVVPDALGLVNEQTGERIAMDAEDDGVFTATFARLAEPITLHADGPTGRSRSLTITPIDRPFILSASARYLVNGEQVVSIEIDLDADPPTLAPPLGATVELTAITSVELVAATLPPGTTHEINGRGITARRAVDQPEPLTLTLTPVSRSGLEANESVSVLVKPFTPPGDRTQGRSQPTSTPDPSEPGEVERGPVEEGLERVRAQIEQMTDEQLAEQAESLMQQIDKLLAQDAGSPSEERAQATLSTLREALADLVAGVPGSSDSARDAAQPSDEEPPPNQDDAERGDPSSDRDRLVTDDPGAVADDGTPPPARLDGDTLVLEGGPDESPIRVTLEGAARDLYASLGDRERAIVARYFRELARQESNREDPP